MIENLDTPRLFFVWVNCPSFRDIWLFTKIGIISRIPEFYPNSNEN